MKCFDESGRSHEGTVFMDVLSLCDSFHFIPAFHDQPSTMIHCTSMTPASHDNVPCSSH